MPSTSARSYQHNIALMMGQDCWTGTQPEKSRPTLFVIISLPYCSSNVLRIHIPVMVFGSFHREAVDLEFHKCKAPFIAFPYFSLIYCITMHLD